MLNVLMTGGREFKDEDFVRMALTYLLDQKGIRRLSTGKARGADTFADGWANLHLLPENIGSYPVSDEEWKKYGKSAGHRRNRHMLLTEKADVLVAFPGNNGTNGCVSACKQFRREGKIPTKVWDLRRKYHDYLDNLSKLGTSQRVRAFERAIQPSNE